MQDTKSNTSRKLTSRQIKVKVFATLCHHSCDFMYGWVPLPCTAIARILNISVYQCRKHMKMLVEEGLAASTSCVLGDEEPLPARGFCLTEKGRNTAIFMYCALREARIFAQCFNARVSDFLPRNFDMRWYPQAAAEQAMFEKAQNEGRKR